MRNGVHDLRVLDAPAVRALEPELEVAAALLSPSTGIVDSHGLMLALQGDLEASGGALARLSPVRSVVCGDAAHVVRVGGETSTELQARFVVNAAGLWAPEVAAAFTGPESLRPPQPRYAKGHYFSLTGRAPFSHLVYPVPEAAGLGVHLTLDLAGQARFGPDVEWIDPASADAIDYRVDARRALEFDAAIRRYWPGLPAGALQPAYSGVRPKLELRGEFQDFVLQGPAVHGVAGVMNLYGIESPGLTASLAIADEVLNRLGVPARPR
jgi:L-2-hydroxyglutarate oxidase LhgO